MNEGRISFLLCDASLAADDPWRKHKQREEIFQFASLVLVTLLLRVYVCVCVSACTQWCIEADTHQVKPVVFHIFGSVECVLAPLKRFVRRLCDQPVVRLGLGGVNNGGVALQVQKHLEQCRCGEKKDGKIIKFILIKDQEPELWCFFNSSYSLSPLFIFILHQSFGLNFFSLFWKWKCFYRGKNNKESTKYAVLLHRLKTKQENIGLFLLHHRFVFLFLDNLSLLNFLLLLCFNSCSVSVL